MHKVGRHEFRIREPNYRPNRFKPFGEPEYKSAGIDVSHKTVTMAINRKGRVGYPVSSRAPPICP